VVDSLCARGEPVNRDSKDAARPALGPDVCLFIDLLQAQTGWWRA